MALAGLITAARPAPVDAALSAGPFPPAGLTVDGLVSPVGIDDTAAASPCARREVRLASSPISRAIAYVSADHQFQLFVNGARVAAGEAFSYPDGQYYQAIDVAPVLRAGVANAVGGLTHWYGL